MRKVTLWILGVSLAGAGAASSTTTMPASAAAELEQASRVYASDLRRSATRLVGDLDEDGDALGEAETRAEHSRSWVERELKVRLPVSTRSVVVKLRAIRKTGGCPKQKKNNGYFDDVSLKLVVD